MGGDIFSVSQLPSLLQESAGTQVSEERQPWFCVGGDKRGLAQFLPGREDLPNQLQ